ncbi:MAG: DEAD/DEAH box helicase family protein [Verrucomicrobia bacterium]|nr:DEAD/DEAH box helicase family protein [Verrucomicrobiota bacterium]
MKEAAAHIKINKLLENAGWRFFADASGPANIRLEPSVALTKQALDGLGEDFEKAVKGFIDFLLLNLKGFPFIVLEAKAENKSPLVGKEQARKYAKSQNCRFVILSNGNLHYFWDLERGYPYLITAFPTPASVAGYQKTTPDPKRLVEEVVGDDYMVLTQRPGYASEAAWKNEAERAIFVAVNALRFLRLYQSKAIHLIQQAIARGLDRFLLEMATGTGKTLTAAAIIKLFLRTGNASRVLFLVDRLELEDQAWKAFGKVLKNDFKTVIYQENGDDWNKAEIVVTTVQSLLFNNKYQRLFSPTDFDLVISDEAHRSIGGNARAVFDYFVGYKLGLTATPYDYLKKYDKDKPTTKDPREFERRLMLDTYRTFGCEDGQPTFRYSLLDGVKDGFLINPTVVADRMFPGKYQSDFAVQVTSQVDGAQQHTINFTNNNLLGSANFIPTYKTSKARVCVTVGMMTTGYDCPDLLNLGLFRPIFSPTDFIQIKGRGTRKHDFREQLFDETIKESIKEPAKTSFKLIDFFANCEYFEKEFKYDEVRKLPKPAGERGEGGGNGEQGMKIDRMFYQKFEDTVRENEFIAASVEAGQWNRVIDYVNKELFDKPAEFYTLEKLRQAAAVDRRLGLREILEKIFDLIPRFKSRDELLEEEFSKFVADCKPDEAEAIPALKNFFKAYATSDHLRHIIESGHLTDLATNSLFSIKDFRAVPANYRTLIPEYIKDYVSLNQFAA